MEGLVIAYNLLDLEALGLLWGDGFFGRQSAHELMVPMIVEHGRANSLQRS